MGSQNGYKVPRGTIVVTTVDEHTLKSAYHTVKKRCAGREDVQKRESSRLHIARRSAGLPSSSLPSALCSIALKPFAPDILSPRAAIDGVTSVRPFSSCSLKSPSTARLFLAQHIQNRPCFKEPVNLRRKTLQLVTSCSHTHNFTAK